MNFKIYRYIDYETYQKIQKIQKEECIEKNLPPKKKGRKWSNKKSYKDYMNKISGLTSDKSGAVRVKTLCPDMVSLTNYSQVYITANAYGGGIYSPVWPGEVIPDKSKPTNYRGYKPRYYGSAPPSTYSIIWWPTAQTTGLNAGRSIDMWHGFLTCRGNSGPTDAPVKGNDSTFYFDSYWDLRDMKTTGATIQNANVAPPYLPTTTEPFTLSLKPNFNTYNPADPFWTNSTTGKGNKIVELNTVLSLTATTPIVGEVAQITIPYRFLSPTFNTTGSDITPNAKIWNKPIIFSGRIVKNTLSCDYEAFYFIKKLRCDITNGTPSYEEIEVWQKELPKCGNFSIKAPASSFPEIDLGKGWSFTGDPTSFFPLNADGNFPAGQLSNSTGIPSGTIQSNNYLVWCGFQIKGLNANPVDEDALGEIVVTSC